MSISYLLVALCFLVGAEVCGTLNGGWELCWNVSVLLFASLDMPKLRRILQWLWSRILRVSLARIRCASAPSRRSCPWRSCCSFTPTMPQMSLRPLNASRIASTSRWVWCTTVSLWSRTWLAICRMQSIPPGGHNAPVIHSAAPTSAKLPTRFINAFSRSRLRNSTWTTARLRQLRAQLRKLML